MKTTKTINKMTRLEIISIGGCFFEYFGAVNVIGTNEIKHFVKLTNPKEDVWGSGQSISDTDWNGLRKFAHNYLGI